MEALGTLSAYIGVLIAATGTFAFCAVIVVVASKARGKKEYTRISEAMRK